MINTIGVIGVAVAIGTVLAAFAALYNTWWMAKKLDRQSAQIAELYNKIGRIHKRLNIENAALKTKNALLQVQINELKK